MKSQRLEQLRRCNNTLKVRSFDTYRTFLKALLSSTNIPQSQQLLDLLLTERYTELVELADSFASTSCRTKSEHLLLNQLCAVIRKYPFPPGSVSFDPEKTALQTFLASEHKCKRVNRRFSLYRKLRSPHEYALNQARSWIAYVLGDFILRDVYDLCAFGPGASVGVSGSATNLARKILSEEWTVTPGAYYYSRSALLIDDHVHEYLNRENDSRYYSFDNLLFNERFERRAKVIDYNKIAFVPKTAKTHRTIAVEPLLNGYLQKGVDSLMRKRLKRVGINLSDQTVNQNLAREGSVLGQPDAYATIDLSSASDSISVELCRYLLPPEWFAFMDSIRSRSYVLKGNNTPYEKFTTMGNGFCFPLETLIFASLCNVAYGESKLKPDFSVYVMISLYVKVLLPVY